MTMATRLATLAMVPVKRVWMAVKPVSKGVPPACANATAGTIRRKVTRVKARRIRFVEEMDARGKGIGDLRGSSIGHLEQPMNGCDMRHARQGAMRCPIAFLKWIIRETNKSLAKTMLRRRCFFAFQLA